jgi:hypothetical protein
MYFQKKKLFSTSLDVSASSNKINIFPNFSFIGFSFYTLQQNTTK